MYLWVKYDQNALNGNEKKIDSQSANEKKKCCAKERKYKVHSKIPFLNVVDSLK